MIAVPSPFRHHGSPGGSGLLRPRLLTELAGPPVPLTLVVGPAGSGKTTLLAHYAAAFPGTVGWLRLDSRDADPAQLVDRLLAALAVTPRGGASGADPSVYLFDALAGLPSGDTLLVLDDLHCVEHSPSEELLERLLVAVQPQLRVAAGGRRLPGFNLSRHEFANVRIIDAEDLRFRAWEVESLLRDVYGEPLPPDDVAALARGVGGWAAGLHLFHLSTRGRPLVERRRAVGALAGRSALTRAYLTRTVLSDLPNDLHRFLVDTCVFDVLTARRCDELLGTTDSQRHLERLEAEQAFTTSPDGGRSFEYHAVLRAYLSVALAERLGDEPARRWHTRAAQILEREGAATEAIRAYARAEDWDAVRRLLAEVGALVAAEGVEPWRDLLPAWLVAEDPWLVFAEGRHRLSQGQHEGAMAAFRRAEALFDTEPGRAMCRSARATVGIWLRNEPGSRAHWGGWLRAAIRRNPAVVASEAEALEGAPGRLVRASASLLAGDLRQARRVLDHRPGADDHPVAGLSLRLLGAAVALGSGDRSAVTALAAIGSDAELVSMPWLARLARAANALELTAEGIKEASLVVEECDHLDDPWGATIAAGIRALAMIMSGSGTDPDELADLVRRCRDLDAGTFEAWAQALLALAVALARLPDTDLELRRAEALARTAGVPGARAAALVAAALTHDQGGTSAASPEDRLAAAHAAAAQAGLPRRAVTILAGGRTGPPGPAATLQAPVSISCFGRFRLHVDGVRLDWSAIRPRARAVLRLLALHGDQPVHRDVIIDAFWPEASPAAATRSLHVALSSLRNLLETAAPPGWPSLLRRDGDAYLLAVPPGGYVDVAAFRATIEEAHQARVRGNAADRLAALRRAVDTYAGELLPEDGPAEWVVRPRDELRRQAAEAAAELAAAELAAADSAAAIHAAQRCVAIDSCHDQGWRSLIAAYREHGDPAAAERARRDYAEVLASLGLDPAGADLAHAALNRPHPAPVS